MGTATELFSQFLTKDGSTREEVIKHLLDLESLPEWWWSFQPVEVHKGGQILVYYASPDYICLGDNSDWLPCPMTPPACRDWMRKHDFVLPTKTMVNQIWNAAPIKGIHPISYSGLYKNTSHNPNRDSTRVYIDQGKAIQTQLRTNYSNFIPGMLVAGHKKDVVLTDYLSNPKHQHNVAIYGWFDGKTGEVIQGLNAVDHSINYVDYSHGLRMIKNTCFLNGIQTTIKNIWCSDILSTLLHDSRLHFQSY